MHKHVLDSLNTAVVLLDHGLHVQYLNPAAEMLFDISDERARGAPVQEIFREEPNNLPQLARVSETGHIFTKRHAVLYPAGHEPLTVDYTVTPVFGLRVNSLLMEIQPQDRVLRISREEEMLAKHQTTRVLVRGMAHEIKNPLGGIRGAAQLLEKELENPELHDYTRVIIEEADRLRNLVDRLLGPTKPATRSAVNIHEALERVCRIIAAEAGAGLELVRDYDPSIPEFEGDPERLIQALLNIVRNAMQSQQRSEQQDDPRIILRTRTARRHTIGGVVHRLLCCIEIIDNGPGIKPDLLENIFYPMVSGRAEGTGLGLSIAQSIVQDHGGLVECETRTGETTFTIFLPLEHPNEQ